MPIPRPTRKSGPTKNYKGARVDKTPDRAPSGDKFADDYSVIRANAFGPLACTEADREQAARVVLGFVASLPPSERDAALVELAGALGITEYIPKS